MTRIKRHYVAICCNGVAINKKDQPSLGFPFLFFDVWIWDPFGCFHTQVHTAFFLQHQRAHVRWSHWFNMVQLPQLLKNVSVILWWTRDIQKQLMCAWIHALTIAGEAHVDGKTKIPMFIRNKDECPTGLLLLSLAHWRFDRGKKRANTLPSGMMAMWFHGPARKTRLKTVIGDVLRAFHKWVGRLWHLQLFLVIGRCFWNVLKFLKPWSDSNSSWGHVWKIESDQTTVIPNWEIGWICFLPFFLLKENEDEKPWAQRLWVPDSEQSAKLGWWDVNQAWWISSPPLAGWPLRHLAGWGGMSSHPPVRSFPKVFPYIFLNSDSHFNYMVFP